MKYNPSGMESTAKDRLRPVRSPQNAMVKQLRRSFAHGEVVEGSCAIEGLRMIEEAIRSGLKVRGICFSESGKTKAERILNQIPAKTEAIVIPDDVFNNAVKTEHPQGVAALVKVHQFRVEQLLKGTNPLLVIAAGIQDPGNLGTILRSAEAFGAGGIILTEKTVSAWNAKVVRSSAGSVFRVPLFRMESSETLNFLKQHGIRSAAAVARGGSLVHEFDFRPPTAILIGNEGAGIPRELIARSDHRVSIAQSDPVESLNAGMAASIILYEAGRQRSNTRE